MRQPGQERDEADLAELFGLQSLPPAGQPHEPLRKAPWVGGEYVPEPTDLAEQWVANLKRLGARVTEAEIPERGYHAILIATDHDNIDYGRLVDLKVPILDTRNAIARRGLSLEFVAKA